MVPLLAKNAVKIKCGFEHACMTGNYECAYALGILTAAAGIDEITDYKTIADLREQVLEKTESFQTDEPALNQLIKLLKDYEASEVTDDQTSELYRMGIADKRL